MVRCDPERNRRVPLQGNEMGITGKGFAGDISQPDALRGPVMSALTGENVDSAADALKGAVGKLFG